MHETFFRKVFRNGAASRPDRVPTPIKGKLDIEDADLQAVARRRPVDVDRPCEDMTWRLATLGLLMNFAMFRQNRVAGLRCYGRHARDRVDPNLLPRIDFEHWFACGVEISPLRRLRRGRHQILSNCIHYLFLGNPMIQSNLI